MKFYNPRCIGLRVLYRTALTPEFAFPVLACKSKVLLLGISLQGTSSSPPCSLCSGLSPSCVVHRTCEAKPSRDRVRARTFEWEQPCLMLTGCPETLA